ncbi:MAG: hypothetical protein AAFY22_02080 [Pseudomonadota bacterium]
MTERLKQIWSGFEGVTTRRLTNRDIDGIDVPRRLDEAADSEALLSEDFAGPAAAAFEALKSELSAKAKKAQRKSAKNAAAADDGDAPGHDWSAAPAPVRDMIRGLKSTEARVRRSDSDYVSHLQAGGALKKKKRFFGIF